MDPPGRFHFFFLGCRTIKFRKMFLERLTDVTKSNYRLTKKETFVNDICLTDRGLL